MAIPVQAFQIGQRVRPSYRAPAFTISWVYQPEGDIRVRYCGHQSAWYWADELTLIPERPPYVASERRIVRLVELCRCETDDELSVRHAIERAEYDRLGTDDPVIYNASGQPVGITNRTGQPGPGAA